MRSGTCESVTENPTSGWKCSNVFFLEFIPLGLLIFFSFLSACFVVDFFQFVCTLWFLWKKIGKDEPERSGLSSLAASLGLPLINGSRQEVNLKAQSKRKHPLLTLSRRWHPVSRSCFGTGAGGKFWIPASEWSSKSGTFGEGSCSFGWKVCLL